MAGSPAGGFNVNRAAAGGLQQAMQGTQAAMGYQPQQVQTSWGYDPERVQTEWGYDPERVAAERAAGGISTYMNPYTQQVIDTSMADLERQRQMQQNQLGAQATAANAFGGSRQGIAEAATNEAFARQGGQLAANLRNQGFTTALGAAQTDAARQLQAGMSNQAAFNAAQQFGQNLGLQSQTANQAAFNAAQQFGQNLGLQSQVANQGADLSGAQLRLSAANQMGGLGQQAFNTGRTISQDQMQQGLMQQGLQQQLIDAARGQYQGAVGAPTQSLSLPLAALGAAPVPQSTAKSKQPGLFDYLSLAGSVAASDIRLKTNIKHLGKENGHNVYSWDWNDDGKRIADPKQPTVGVMAQELQETHPHLVELGPDGFLRVDYSGLAAEAT